MNQIPYQHAYAKHAPEMRARWAGQRDPAILAAAKADIICTLQYHEMHDAYAGKLYAELDAIRDAELAIRDTQNHARLFAIRGVRG